MSKPKVSVIILNYKDAEDTFQCVQSVQRSDYHPLEILVVDNESAEAAFQTLKGGLPGIEIIRNKENLGYAGGNNRGIRRALQGGCDFIMVLNNDAWVESDTITRLVGAAENTPEANIFGPKIYYDGRGRIINSLGTRLDWFRLRPYQGFCGLKDTGQVPDLKEVQVLPGAAILMRRRLFDEVGFFDEGYFLIHEDADLCLRNIRRGFKNMLEPHAIVHHKVSGSLSKYPFLMGYYSTRNFLYLARDQQSSLIQFLVKWGLGLNILRDFLKWFFVSPDERLKIQGSFRGSLHYLKGLRGAYSDTGHAR